MNTAINCVGRKAAHHAATGVPQPEGNGRVRGGSASGLYWSSEERTVPSRQPKLASELCQPCGWATRHFGIDSWLLAQDRSFFRQNLYRNEGRDGIKPKKR
jgi:hypothetical protein